MAIELITEATTNGARISKACAELEINRKTYWRWCTQLRDDQKIVDRRTLKRDASIAKNRLTDAEKSQIIAVCNTPEFKSVPPGQIVPTLADRGVYIASESSFYRVLKEYGQNNRRGRVSVPQKRAKPDEVLATAPNMCWTWDITFLKRDIRGLFFKLYLIKDIFSKKIVGWEIHEEESAEYASVLVNKACKREKIKRNQLVLHADNGSPMKGATLLATLDKLGVTASYSRPSVSNDNAFSESLFKTLKYSPNFPEKPFASIVQARAWVYDFVMWYNNHHRHSAIKYVTPNEKHAGLDLTILKNRDDVYSQAKGRRPERWSGKTRNWGVVTEVSLNPDTAKT